MRKAFLLSIPLGKVVGAGQGEKWLELVSKLCPSPVTGNNNSLPSASQVPCEAQVRECTGKGSGRVMQNNRTASPCPFLLRQQINAIARAPCPVLFGKRNMSPFPNRVPLQAIYLFPSIPSRGPETVFQMGGNSRLSIALLLKVAYRPATWAFLRT